MIVLVAVNYAKNPAFSADDRTRMIQKSVDAAGLKNVRVDSFSDGLLVDYVEQNNARVIVKGLRAVSDFEHEFAMHLVNRRLRPRIETIFMMTGADYSFLSSSIVREIARLGGNISGLVPDAASGIIKTRLAGSDGVVQI